MQLIAMIHFKIMLLIFKIKIWFLFSLFYKDTRIKYKQLHHLMMHFNAFNFTILISNKIMYLTLLIICKIFMSAMRT